MLQKLLQDKNRNITFKKKESTFGKKDRRLVFLFFVLTSLFSFVLWLKSGNFDFKFFSFSLPAFFSKTYIFKKKASQSQLKSRPPMDLLEKEILEFLDGKIGNYGIWFKDLVSEESFGFFENEVFLAASVNKLPIMLAFYQAVEAGRLEEGQVYTLRDEDKQEGTGSMQSAPAGTKYFYEELIRLSGIESDNTANKVMLDIVGFNNVKQSLEAMGLERTLIDKNTTTPWESGRIFELVFKDELLNKENSEKFFNFLTNTFFEDRIPAGVPEGIRVAHKIGNYGGVYNDCGIVFGQNPYVLCILTKPVGQNEAKEVLPEISRIVWRFISQ